MESPLKAGSKVLIPGTVHSVPSPDGSGARIFYREHTSPDGSQASPVFYDDGHAHIQQIATLQRHMEISWSHDGKSAFLEDNWGSNVADCYVLTRTSSGIAGVSLLKQIQRTPGHPAGAEVPFRSHYYVHCKAWTSGRQVVGEVEGYTDTQPSHAFNRQFSYDVHKHRIAWRR
uniref:hypothetical protein n=1 Tax=Altererythrobacter segetis TaxID=1104773 RepID=UPI00140D3A6C|nr:hypothetical protein [Altererythrobacter segetis]